MNKKEIDFIKELNDLIKKYELFVVYDTKADGTFLKDLNDFELSTDLGLYID